MILDLIIYTPMYVTAFWAIVLYSISRPSHNRAKFLLGGFMVIAFLLYTSHAIYFQHIYRAFLWFDPIYTLCSLSVYPLYFWYIKLLTIENRFKRRNWLLFAPAAAFPLASAIVYIIMGRDEADNFIQSFYYNQATVNSPLANLQKILFFGSRAVFAIQVIFFLIYGSRLVRKYNDRIANFYSDTEDKSIVWVNLLLKSFVATSLVSIVFNLLGKSSFVDSGYILAIPSMIFSTLLFFIGFQGFLQNYTVADLLMDELEPTDLKASSSKQIAREKLKGQLLELFNEQEIFLNHNLKITLVSEKLNTNRTYLSNLINEEFESPFSDFVGKFRVQKAKQLLEEDRELKFSIDFVAEQVGFGSTSSFIRMFKKIEGITPGSYRNRISEETITSSKSKTSI